MPLRATLASKLAVTNAKINRERNNPTSVTIFGSVPEQITTKFPIALSKEMIEGATPVV